MKTAALLLLAAATASCSRHAVSNSAVDKTVAEKLKAEWWMTTANRSSLIGKQATITSSAVATGTSVVIDTTTRYQAVEGFGYTLTGGSAQLINGMDAASKGALLQELFGADGIRVSYLRISVGASDLNGEVFTYDDVPAGQSDPTLSRFTLDKDRAAGTGLIPLLKEILTIAPDLKIMASPWTAPVWMKDNGNSMGGSLQKAYYGAYANYLVKYIQQMMAEGIKIDALTPQNEPLHGGNNPSMVMQAVDQAEFIRDHLGPAFRAAGINTRIIAYDHNCNKPEYPITILNDAVAKQYVSGSAFHLYEGDISALSTVKQAHPDKDLYFTEQWTGAKGSFDGDLMWHMKNVVIGSMQNWSRVALEWNLANDPDYNPHTPGGCTECKGALTISGNRVERNVSYYIIGQVSKFIPRGSVVLRTSSAAHLPAVAFIRPDGKKVLLVMNDSDSAAAFNIVIGNSRLAAGLPAKAVATLVIGQ